MYLFTRTAHLARGNPMAGISWASEVCAKIRETTDHEFQLWTNVFSPEVGTLVWSTWVEDLQALEGVSDKLQADGGYLSMLELVPQLFEGVADDALVQPLYGAPDPERSVQYVSVVTAAATGGNIERAVGLGLEIAQRAEAITGTPGMLLRSITGPYGALGWMSGYADIAALQAADEALLADPTWLQLIDSTGGCFLEDTAFTQQRLYRRIV